MSDKTLRLIHHRTLEEGYFRRKEIELIEKMRAKLATEETRLKLAAQTHVHDTEVLSALQDLGYTTETITLLHLVPFVQVAWASGTVSMEEYSLVMRAARERRITLGSQADLQLHNWLTHRPSNDFFARNLRVMQLFMEALPKEHRVQRENNLLAYCTRIAQVSGGFLGFGRICEGERQSLRQIAAALSSNDRQTASPYAVAA